MKQLNVIIALLLAIQFSAYSQDTLWLLNGKRLLVKDAHKDSLGNIVYKNEKGKTKTVETIDVFSLKKQDKTETVFYKQDSVNDFNLSQMRDFINGEFDGRTKFKDNAFANTAPYAIGFGAQLLMPFVGLVFVAPVLPAGYCVFAGKKSIKAENLNIAPQYANNEHYKIGYQISARKKRLNHSLIGGAVGLVTGLAASYLIFGK